MEIILEILFTVFFEFLGPIIAELFVETGFRTSRDVLKKEEPEDKMRSFFTYIFIAACLACISIAIKPHLLIKSLSFQILNLILCPLVAGFLMAYRRKSLIAKGKKPIQLDTFLNGAAFAFTFCLIRFLFHKPF